MTPARAEAYDRHTGRYGPELSEAFASFAPVRPAFCRSLAESDREALREEFRRRLGDPRGSFRLVARAWAVRGCTARDE